jgi:hypothetical protein
MTLVLTNCVDLGADLNLTFPFFPDREQCPERILKSMESLPNFIPPDQFAMCDIYTTNSEFVNNMYIWIG